MKTGLSILFVLLLSIPVFGQYQFQYELNFKIDSTDLDHTQTDYFNLEVDENQSIFYNHIYEKADSLKAAGENIFGKDMPEAKIEYLVKKDLEANKQTFVEVIGFDRYEIEETRAIDWDLADETKTFQVNSETAYTLQKATTTFAGRNWVAWYTTEITVQDGPYKFYGLPGLIVQLHDEHNDYDFQLTAVRSIDRIFQDNVFKALGIETLQATPEKYRKIKTRFQKNPGAVFKQHMKSTMNMEMPESEVKNYNDSQKKRQAKQKNTLELEDL